MSNSKHAPDLWKGFQFLPVKAPQQLSVARDDDAVVAYSSHDTEDKHIRE